MATVVNIILILLLLDGHRTISIENIFSVVDIIILSLIIAMILLLIIAKETCFFDFKKVISEVGYKITLVVSLFLFMILLIFFILQPSQIITDPIQFEMKIPAGDISTKSMLIKYMGFSKENITLNNSKFDYGFLNCSNFNQSMKSDENKILNCNLKVYQNTTPGEYREIINFIQDGKPIKDIPIFLTILPKAQYRVDIDPIPKVNASEYFKLKVTITNTGEAPVYGVNISLNEDINNGDFNLKYSENNKPNNTLMNNSSFITYWWIGTNNETETLWKSVHFNITSENAGNQTAVTMINIEKH